MRTFEQVCGIKTTVGNTGYSSLLRNFLPKIPRFFAIFGSWRKILADFHATNHSQTRCLQLQNSLGRNKSGLKKTDFPTQTLTEKRNIKIIGLKNYADF
jgi:hypothetical protein